DLGHVTTYEFVDGSVAGRTAQAGHTAVNFNSTTDNIDSLRQEMIAAINGVAALYAASHTGVDPKNDVVCTARLSNDGTIELDGLNVLFDPGSTRFSQTGSTHHGAVYEFIDLSQAIPTTVTPGFTPVYFNGGTDTIDAIRTDMVATINGFLVVKDAPTALNVAALNGTTFTVSDKPIEGNLQSVTFEFTTSGTLAAGDTNTAINISTATNAAAVAAAIVNTINAQTALNALSVTATGLDYGVALDGSAVTVNTSTTKPGGLLYESAGFAVRAQAIIQDFSGNLPGTVGTIALRGVHVVYSTGTTPFSHIGPTAGAYQLQVRLQEMYEVPGSVIQGANIFYASTPIQALGLPDNSPLETTTGSVSNTATGETGTNNTFATAQDLGNLLAQNLGTITVGGYMNNQYDVQWYKMTVDLQGVQRIAGVSGTGAMWPTIFDVGYADGLSRPDLTLWIFNSAGQLILTGTNSDIIDQQAAPAAGGNSTSDLSRSSYGTGDPYIGRVFLPEHGQTYYIAVTTTGLVADAATNPQTRVEPVDSIARVVEDHIYPPNDTIPIGDPLPAPNLSGLPTAAVTDLNLTPMPYTLSDVNLYALTSYKLYTVDPLTGAGKTDVTQNPPGVLLNSPVISYGDIAMRNDGKLYTFTQPNLAGGNRNPVAVKLDQIDTGDATVMDSQGTSGISTYMMDPANPKPAIVVDNTALTVNALVEGLGNQNRGVLAVANAPNDNNGIYEHNLVYRFDDNGVALNSPDTTGNPRLPTNVVPLAQLLTGATFTVTDATIAGLVDSYNPATGLGANSEILDGSTFGLWVTDPNTGQYVKETFEFDTGPDIRTSNGGSNNAFNGQPGPMAVRDGQTFMLDDATNGPQYYEFDSGPVVLIPGASALLPGDTITITDTTAGAPKTVNFEFQNTTNAALPDPPNANIIPGAVVVGYKAGMTAHQVLGALLTAGNGGSNLVLSGFVDQSTGLARLTIVNDAPNSVTVGNFDNPPNL
ncbi:MAG: hypothetical protein ABSG68_25945, partial [Thermoguttaceae bacterium]